MSDLDPRENAKLAVTLDAIANGRPGKNGAEPGDAGFPLLVEHLLAATRINETEATSLLEQHAFVAYEARHGVSGRKQPQAVLETAPEIRPEAADTFSLEVTTARAFCASPDPVNDELLGAFAVRGNRVLIGGHTGEGKTTLALAMVKAIVAGDEFLGFRGVGGVRALVLDAEQGAKSLKRRLREAELADRDDVDVIRVPDGLALDSDPQHVAAVERVLAEGGYSVVLIDPLYKLHEGDANVEREAVDLMRLFDAWRERYGFVLLLPIHCRKPVPGMKFSIHDLFGSSAYTRGPEVAVGLQRLSDGYARLTWLKDRDGDLPLGTSWGLLFSREEGFRRDPNDGKRETALDKVLDALSLEPGLTQDDLMTRTGNAERTVRDALRQLKAVGDGRKPEHWSLPPERLTDEC